MLIKPFNDTLDPTDEGTIILAVTSLDDVKAPASQHQNVQNNSAKL